MRKSKKSLSSLDLVGIDEAGRGPLAGPLAIGFFAVHTASALRQFRGVKDSKQLSERQREEWFARIRSAATRGEIAYTVAMVQARTIDELGLSPAIRRALDRGLRRLVERGWAAPETTKILLDGSLYAPRRYASQETIIDGDAKEPIIALASICAKVTRDRRLKRLAKLYPAYGFEIHKGYGTKVHYAALRRHGLSPEHRRSFLKNFSGQK